MKHFLTAALVGLFGAWSGAWAQEEYHEQDSQRGREERAARIDDSRRTRERYQPDQRQSGQRDRELSEETQQFIERHDRNRDRQLTRQELPQHMRDGFGAIDRNDDQRLSATELEIHAQNLQRYSAMPVEVTYIWITGANRGRLDVNELQQVYTLLRRADQNGDGRLTTAELRQQRQKVASECVECILESRDENSDGKLTRSEARGTAVAFDFSRIDRNSDGSVTKDELRRATQIDTREDDEEEDDHRHSDSESESDDSSERQDRRRDENRERE
jgi:Ca2+-binding EF-hand superfamily protein